VRGGSNGRFRRSRRSWILRDIGSGLKLWFEASLGITTSSGVVTTWAESSKVAANKDLTAASSARPTYNSADSTILNRPSLTFDGSANQMGIPTSTTLTGSASFVFVYKNDDANTTRTLLSDLEIGGTSLLWQSSASYQMLDEAGHNSQKSLTLAAQWHVLIVTATNGAQAYYLDAATTATATDTIAWGNFIVTKLGARNSTSFFKGKIAEWAAFDRVLTAGEINLTAHALGAKYGISVAA
jgi:hypothetical protein